MILERARKSLFLRDSSVLQAGALCLAFGNLLGMVALTHVLGARGQGEFYLAVALYSALWFALNLGLYQVTISKVAAALGQGETRLASAWLAYLVRGSIVLALVTAGLAWWLLPHVVRAWFGEGVDDPEAVARNAALLCLIPLVEIPRVVACAAFTGTRRMWPLARVENGQEASRVLLVVVGALVTGSARGPVIGMLVAAGIGSLLALEAWLREARLADSRLPRMGEVLAAGGDLPLGAGLRTGIQMGLVRNVDAYGVQILPALLLGRFGSAEWVAYLRVAQRLVEVARIAMQGIGRTALPVLSELGGVRDRRRLENVYWKASALSGLTVGAGLLASLAVIPWVIDTLFPRDYQDPVWTCLLILLPGVLVLGFSVANDTFYLVTGTLRVGILLSLIGLVVNTSVVAFLAWRMPTVGVAWGLAFTYLWSLVHLAYAAFWFRGQRVAGGPTVGAENPST